MADFTLGSTPSHRHKGHLHLSISFNLQIEIVQLHSWDILVCVFSPVWFLDDTKHTRGLNDNISALLAGRVGFQHRYPIGA